MARIRSLLVVATAAAALASAQSASAGPLVANAPSCDAQSLLQPFLPWADVATYTLQPGGDFESGPSWTGGSVTTGNEPFNVGASTDSHSLALSAGAVSTSPEICVGIQHPDIRFFAKGGNVGSLRVEVLFEDANGNVQSLPIGSVAGSGSWALTPPMLIGANLLPLLPGQETPVAFRFTAVSGNWQIDDVYVDPYNRN